MARVNKTNQALQDLDNIWMYIAADSPQSADALIDRVEERCRRLADHPFLGTACELFEDDLLFFPVGNYMIFYYPLDDGIELVRVLHSARDIEKIW